MKPLAMEAFYRSPLWFGGHGEGAKMDWYQVEIFVSSQVRIFLQPLAAEGLDFMLVGLIGAYGSWKQEIRIYLPLSSGKWHKTAALWWDHLMPEMAGGTFLCGPNPRYPARDTHCPGLGYVGGGRFWSRHSADHPVESQWSASLKWEELTSSCSFTAPFIEFTYRCLRRVSQHIPVLLRNHSGSEGQR